MASNKIIIESHPKGLYQVRINVAGNKEVYAEDTNLTFEKAMNFVEGLRAFLRIEKGISIKQKNIIVEKKAVIKNAAVDESSREFLMSDV